MKHLDNYIIGHDGTLLEKLELEKYLAWKKSFYDKEDGRHCYLRFGQAFLNEQYPGVVMSKLFYETDSSVAETIIYQTFLDVV